MLDDAKNISLVLFPRIVTDETDDYRHYDEQIETAIICERTSAACRFNTGTTRAARYGILEACPDSPPARVASCVIAPRRALIQSISLLRVIIVPCICAPFGDLGPYVNLSCGPPAPSDSKGKPIRIGPVSAITPAETNFVRQNRAPVSVSFLESKSGMDGKWDFVLSWSDSCATALVEKINSAVTIPHP